MSFDQQLNKFVIAYKNKHFFYPNELKCDDSPRDMYKSRLNSFFEEFSSKLDENQLFELKQALHEHTFVGAYLGGFFNKQVIQYNKEQVQFYAVVKKKKFDNDLVSFKRSKDFITKFGLNFTNHKKVKTTKSQLPDLI